MSLDFIAGLFGGAAGVIVGHPFDTVKVHMQTDDPKNPKYKGTFDCFRQILQKDGFRGVYRGITSPMAGIGVVNAVVFGVYGNVQRLSSEPESLSTHFSAGCIAGVAQSFVCSPMELAKTRLQLSQQIDSGIKFTGPLHCLKHIFMTEGIRGTFKGLVATILRDMPGFASYFVTYEYLMRKKADPGTLYTLVTGGVAGCASWVVCYPMDVVKTHMQADALGKDAKYTGFIDCAMKGYRHEGRQYFFRGLTSTLIRAFPMNASCFFVVAWILEYWGPTKSIKSVANTEQSLTVMTLDNRTQADSENGAASVEEAVRKLITDNAMPYQPGGQPHDVVHSRFTTSNAINIPKESKSRMANDCNLK